MQGTTPAAGTVVDGPVKRDEYHLVAEYLPNGMVRTRCGVIMPAETGYGPGRRPCGLCHQPTLHPVEEPDAVR